MQLQRWLIGAPDKPHHAIIYIDLYAPVQSCLIQSLIGHIELTGEVEIVHVEAKQERGKIHPRLIAGNILENGSAEPDLLGQQFVYVVTNNSGLFLWHFSSKYIELAAPDCNG